MLQHGGRPSWHGVGGGGSVDGLQTLFSGDPVLIPQEDVEHKSPGPLWRCIVREAAVVQLPLWVDGPQKLHRWCCHVAP